MKRQVTLLLPVTVITHTQYIHHILYSFQYGYFTINIVQVLNNPWMQHSLSNTLFGWLKEDWTVTIIIIDIINQWPQTVFIQASIPLKCITFNTIIITKPVTFMQANRGFGGVQWIRRSNEMPISWLINHSFHFHLISSWPRYSKVRSRVYETHSNKPWRTRKILVVSWFERLKGWEITHLLKGFLSKGNPELLWPHASRGKLYKIFIIIIPSHFWSWDVESTGQPASEENEHLSGAE